MIAERVRLAQQHEGTKNWRRWGPYLSDRQWGTVREDYSRDGDAWGYVSHDKARSYAYRWGEDGLAGICDEFGRLGVALALWNEADPILKERLFGLTNEEGNHGEDVKELYYHLDATPTHSYLKWLYKYPQRAFPYARLIEENHRRGRLDPEFELIDTGVFDDDRYFDVEVEYAKASPNDILMCTTVHNRGPDPAPIHVLPQFWFRNTWSWKEDSERPIISVRPDGSITAVHSTLKQFYLFGDGATDTETIFCDNETNLRRLYGAHTAVGYYKDAFHDLVVHGDRGAVNPNLTGTKGAWHHRFMIPPGESRTVRLRLSRKDRPTPFDNFDTLLQRRRNEADAYYNDLQQGIEGDDACLVHRQALAGMIWNKQFYAYDVTEWLEGDPTQPPPAPERRHTRNSGWKHLNNADVLSMPDTWEFPWYAAWDLAFHCIPLALVDAEFAKEQLILMTREWYMHPNGQLPAYEWNFSDVNPPVQAWATWRVFEIDRKQRGGDGDVQFLKRMLHKLLLNFTWWVNRKDVHGRNIFQGGFLGLDNIGVFDRSSTLPDGGYLNQADATAWMAMYSLNLLRISLEIAQHESIYEDLATKFFEHFLYIAGSMTNMADEGIGLWDLKDEFYYDAIQMPDDRKIVLKIRSMVGLIPLFAVEVIEPERMERLPKFAKRLEWFLKYRPDLSSLVSHWEVPGKGQRHLLSLLRGHRMKRLLARMLDPEEFLSDYGVRALSKVHRDHPYIFDNWGIRDCVSYVPGESDTGLFGGNSNWRGPIWMPVNFLIVEALRRFHRYYGDEFKIECPTGSGQYVTIDDVATEIARRLSKIFLRGDDGRRPFLGDCSKQQNDPHFRDHLLFHEYFHGDTGRGLGASHQTGWTGLIAYLLLPHDREHATVVR